MFDLTITARQCRAEYQEQCRSRAGGNGRPRLRKTTITKALAIHCVQVSERDAGIFWSSGLQEMSEVQM